MLDDAAYNGNAAATGTGPCRYASPALTWTGNLNPGDSATVTFSVTVSNPDTDNHLLASTVTSARRAATARLAAPTRVARVR